MTIISCKNKHNVSFPYLLSKLPGLLKLCWVILVGTSQNIHNDTAQILGGNDLLV